MRGMDQWEYHNLFSIKKYPKNISAIVQKPNSFENEYHQITKLFKKVEKAWNGILNKLLSKNEKIGIDKKSILSEKQQDKEIDSNIFKSFICKSRNPCRNKRKKIKNDLIFFGLGNCYNQENSSFNNISQELTFEEIKLILIQVTEETRENLQIKFRLKNTENGLKIRNNFLKKIKVFFKGKKVTKLEQKRLQKHLYEFEQICINLKKKINELEQIIRNDFLMKNQLKFILKNPDFNYYEIFNNIKRELRSSSPNNKLFNAKKIGQYSIFF